MSLQKMSMSYSLKSANVPLLGKDVTDVIKLRVLYGEIILDYLGGPNVTVWVLIRSRRSEE